MLSRPLLENVRPLLGGILMVIISFVVETSCFNIDSSITGVKYLTSPIIEQLGEIWPGSTVRQLPNSVKPSYYGNSFSLIRQGDNAISVVVGAPKAIDQNQISLHRTKATAETKPQGFLQRCPINFSGLPGLPCKYVNPPSIEPGDNIGLTASVQPEGDIVNCSPTRELKCSSMKYNPGFCYKSTDYGGNWRKEGSRNTECPSSGVDVLFVLDGSGSVGKNFDKVKDWVKNITAKLDIGKEIVRVGVVQYSHYVEGKSINKQKYITTEISIGEFKLLDNFENAVDRIQLQGYTTYTGRALQKVIRDFDDAYIGNKQVLLLLTDGQAKDNKLILPNANRLRNKGIATFAVGVGEYDISELKLIASGTDSTDRVFTVTDFGELDSIVKSLQTEIQSFVLEGGKSAKTAGYEMHFGENGFSVAYAKSETNEFLLLGAPGAYDWSGAVTKYDSISDTTADIPTYEDVQGVLPNRTKESYMGYTLTTGFFEGPRAGEFAATGAPRYMLKGAVVVFKPEKDSAKFNQPHRIMANEANSQLGSYFGGSLLSVDINGDDIDDLFIGAPLYSGVTHDEGRVYVYVSKPGGRTLSSWTDSSYEPLVLDGMRLIGGRFGTAIASAGDLNNDKMNDVIIGAPMTEGDRGAIFIYHGKKNGFDTNLKQMILASELTGVNLKYFGQSIQGGVDLDGNLYPDVAVGAPKSDTVVIFRSRAVVEIIATVTFLQSKIDIFNCIDNNYVNCTSVQVCFTAQGRSIESVIGLTYNLTLDSGKQSLGEKRLEFRDALSPTGVTTIRQDLPLKSKTRTCVTRGVNVKANIKDYDTTVNVTVTYDLQASHTDQALSSIRDPTAPNTATDSLVFDKNCGVEGQCQYDLKLSGSLLLPPATLTGGEDLTNGGKILIVSDQTDINRVIVKLNLTNKGQNAFGTQVKVDYTSELSWSRIEKRQGVPATNSCIEALGQPVDMGNGLLRQILQYNYRTSIMQQNSWCYFEISFLTRNLRNNGKLDSLNIDVNAFSSDTTNSSIEVNPSDNSWRQTRLIKYRSDFTVEEQSTDPDIQYNFTNTERNITSVKQIGQNTSDVVINYKIRGTGYSNIPTVTIRLIWPSKTAANYSLLYLHSVACNTKYTTANPEKGDNNLLSCNCEMDKVNIYNLSTDAPNENNTGGARFITEPATVYLDQKEYNCFSQEGNHTCETMTCNINNLGSSTEVNFIALFRLVTSTFNLTNTSNSDTNLISRFEAFETSPIILNKAGKNNSFANPASRVARKYTEPIIVVPVNNIWIYILAAVGGLLLLIAIAAILWKVGFFKSKYADMKKDAQDDMDDAADFPGPNNGGSTADIVDN